MSEFINIIPWFDSNEWQKVYKLIYAEDSCENDKITALNLLRIWKARCPALPSGIESTLNLLQVHIQDFSNSDNISNDQLYRLAYSSAIMRFVNHMLDAETSKGSSFYKAATNLGVPDWIIDLRHDTAHSNNLPSIELLREACIISLDWLKINYWDKYTNIITNYVTSSKEIDSDDINIHKIELMINFCIHINICIHSGSKIKNLADIPDLKLKKSLIDEIEAIFGNKVNLSDLKLISMQYLESLIRKQFKNILIVRNAHKYVTQVLLGTDSLLLSLELLNCFDPSPINTIKCLPFAYTKCFENLFILLHDNELLQDFVLDLINFTSYDGDSNTRLLATLWVSEILNAFKRLKKFNDMTKKLKSDDLSSGKYSELVSLFHHWFPNEKKGILLKLLKPVPSLFTVVTNIQPILSTYNPYLSHFVYDMLQLVEPPLPKSTIKKICSLARLISNPEKYPVKITATIYTQPYCKPEQSKKIVLENNAEEISAKSQQSTAESSTWTLASTEHLWSACPIGVLPWQI